MHRGGAGHFGAEFVGGRRGAGKNRGTVNGLPGLRAQDVLEPRGPHAERFEPHRAAGAVDPVRATNHLLQRIRVSGSGQGAGRAAARRTSGAHRGRAAQPPSAALSFVSTSA